MFVVVTPNVTALAHSRDWIAWETGIGARRDVWVLEKREHAGQVRVVTPSLKHLVRFDPSDPWFAYFRAIITSYDDSHVLPALVAGGTVGNAFRRGEGAIVGAGIALIITSMLTQQPRGVPIVCGKCSSRYSVHLPSGEPQFRCPVCNEVLGLALTQPVLGALPPAAG